jgi:hypothetical protein
MLDQLLNSEHSQIFDIVKNFAGVSNEHNESATNVIKETLANSLSQKAQTGDLSGLMEMFSGTQSNSSSPAAAGISADLVSGLVSKLGIDSGNASGLVQQLLPVVLNMFNNKVSNAQSNGVDVAGLIGQFVGGQGGGGNMANIASVISMFTGGGQNQAANSNDGFGLDDILNIGKKFL